MSAIRAFGAFLPAQVVTNEQLAGRLHCTPNWIREVSGIQERRYAQPEESIVTMAVTAAQQCLERAGRSASDIGMLIVSSGSADRRFPGPASVIAHQLNATGSPAIDLPIASAGGLFAMALAARLAESHGNILVFAAEKMS